MAIRDPFERRRDEALAVNGEEAAIYRDRARRLGLTFTSAVDLGTTDERPDLDGIAEGVIARVPGRDGYAYIAPDEDTMPEILVRLAQHPSSRTRLRVAPRSVLRAAMVAASSRALVRGAIRRLGKRDTELSARRVVTGAQTIAALALIAGLAAATTLAPLATLVTINLVGAVFFFGVTVLRLVAADHAKRRAEPIEWVDDPVDPTTLPTYTILVPLHQEAEMVSDLVTALDRLDWPRDKLDIKLLLEADDAPTIAAARFATRGAPYEILLVPPIGPRTKPKALAFGLPLARGTFVTVYDAEDRPHPEQLREAYAAFRRAGPEVACLQSALVIDNGHENWLALSFSIEYAALFDALLPTLSALRLPLPLGGTSNHFRRAVLEETGGWDPYNVTEDADLGIRLARFGYRCEPLDLPTLEEAPVTLGAWLRQRTRWSKGWMQTWLVHTRHPVKLARDLGARGLLGFNLISTGLIVSALIYPIYLAALFTGASDPRRLWADGDVFASMVIGVNLFNLVAGYLAMAILCSRALKLRHRMREARGLVLLPVYWFLTSVATYRALVQLVLRPHHWEKTPHRRRAVEETWEEDEVEAPSG